MPSNGQKRPNLDSVTTINADGSRHILHPADVRGKWTVMRRVFGYLLLAVYVLLPWIPINGNPAVLFDVENRRFHLFGLTLVPQDLWVLFFGISGLGFGLFFVTALLGRVWCGWACPYTVFLEHIFRRIERLIDGDSVARRKLAQAPWTASKAVKRVVKQALYALAATSLAHVFLAYFIPLPRLYGYMQEGPLAHASAFGIVAFLSIVLWFCFGWFREQFCIVMCPYGRLQSALTDEETLIVGYDTIRGEPRGAKGKAEGDCIDCQRCIKVCPTGIDIRNGLQMECIGCTACIDACDEIMTKVQRPTGLIRYDSQTGLDHGTRRFLRPRLLLYVVLGSLGLTAFGFTMTKKARPYTADFSRMRGQPFYVAGPSVRNHFQVRFLNKRNQPVRFTLELGEAPEGYALSGAGEAIAVPAHGEVTRPAIVVVSGNHYAGPADITFELTADPGGVTFTHDVRFLGPDANSINP